MPHHQPHLPDIKPLSVSPPWTVAELMGKMAGTSFQARNLARGAAIWEEMLKGEATIFFGLAGAMIPAGMRSLMVYLIENRLIDCLVSTGANLVHDLQQTLGQPFWQGEHQADDVELAEAGIVRYYDTYSLDKDLEGIENFIVDFTCSLPARRAYTSHEFLYRLGQQVAATAKVEGMITAAARAGVPIFCPALGDSVYGTAFAAARIQRHSRFLLDEPQDVADMIKLVAFAPRTGAIFIGGGTPKNFIQQAGLCASFYGREFPGHGYAIQVTTDMPQWGGLSGCTFEEARSWRKIAPDAHTVTIYADATIALPLLVSTLAERAGELIKKRRKRPSLRKELAGPDTIGTGRPPK